MTASMQDQKTKKVHIAIPVLIMIFIFVQSAFPSDLSGRESGLIVSLVRHFWDADPETITLVVRKCAHFIEYLALGWSLMFPVLDKLGQKDLRYAMLISWLIGTVYAMTDEIHQIFVDGRSCQLSDMALDSAGTLAGIVIAVLLIRSRKVKDHQDDKPAF